MLAEKKNCLPSISTRMGEQAENYYAFKSFPSGNKGTCRDIRSPLCYGTDTTNSEAATSSRIAVFEEEMCFKKASEAQSMCPGGKSGSQKFITNPTTGEHCCVGTPE